MKSTLLAGLLLVSVGFAQQTPAPAGEAPAAAPAMSVQPTQRAEVGNGPTPADIYCSGFISTDKVPDNVFVAAGWNSPDQTRFASTADYIYLRGAGPKEGDRYQIVRHVRDLNHYELYPGQKATVRNAGEAYFELGIVKIIQVQKNTAVAVPELGCADFVPGDIAIPFQERQAPAFHNVALDRFAPPSGSVQGRIIMAKEFDSFIGWRDKVYLNIGADKGLKPGDYLRATRTYSSVYRDRDAGLSLKASTVEDSQKDARKLPPGDVSSLPRKTVGDMMVLQVHKKSATAMIMTALEDIKVGDGVELMDISNAPVVAPIAPAFSNNPPPSGAASNAALAAPPTITCSAAPTTVRAGETSIISCNATSPDNRPISIAFVANGGRLSSSRNQATLDTTDTAAGPIAVRATAFDDRQMNSSAVTTVNVEAAPSAATPTAQKLTELDFKPSSAYVDNRSKAVLDDVALKMQQDPVATAVLQGASEGTEPPRLANQRAQNAMDYLTKSKGIDPQRIQVKSGNEMGRKVQIWTVPAGAPPPGQQPPPMQQQPQAAPEAQQPVTPPTQEQPAPTPQPTPPPSA